MSQAVDDILAQISQILHMIDQGKMSEQEASIVAMVLSGIANPDTRDKILSASSRTLSTIPPPPPGRTNGHIVIESERDHGKEPTIGIDVPVSGMKPPGAIPGRVTRSMEYHFDGEPIRDRTSDGKKQREDKDPTKRSPTARSQRRH